MTAGCDHDLGSRPEDGETGARQPEPDFEPDQSPSLRNLAHFTQQTIKLDFLELLHVNYGEDLDWMRGIVTCFSIFTPR